MCDLRSGHQPEGCGRNGWHVIVAGYLTVADGIIGPWMLDHFRVPARAPPAAELHYVVLRPRREVALARVRDRRNPDALVDEPPILHMWVQFADLGDLEGHVLDTSDEDDATTEGRLATAVASGSMRISLV